MRQQKTKKKTWLRRITSLPGKMFNTRVRLSFAMAFSVLTLVMMAQPIGLIPDRNEAIMLARKLQTETLAVSGSAIAEASGGSLREFEKTLESAVERSDELISSGLRLENNQLAFTVGDHQTLWEMPKDGRSNDRHMFVPIHRSGNKIAQLELCYRPLVNLAAIVQSAIAKLAMFLFLGSFVMFNIFLFRTLRQLDPRGAVPQRVREAFDAMAEALLILDRKGNIMMANDKFCGVVGKTAEELNGGKISDFDWQTNSAELPWAESIKTKSQVTEAIVEVADAKSQVRTFSVSVAPVLTAKGTLKGLIVTFDDITMLEQHKRELVQARKAADDANEAKSNFLSRMSHEIRTPMNAIIGYTDILQQGDTDAADQLRYLTTIQTSSEHLLSLINDILDLSKIEAGQMTIEQRQVPVVPLVNQVIETLMVKAQENDLYLKFEIDGQIPREITTDETRLRQVLINTIGNAIKFTKSGGVTLVARHLDTNNGMMEFDVVDTGIGISESALSRIFDPFSQADDTVTRKFGGTGLGLAICKQLSESMGGGINATSTEGVGTTFSIRITSGDASGIALISDADKSAESVLERKAVKTTYEFERGHILVVDDSQANRDLASLMLKRLGLTTKVAVNGMEALEKISDEKFDVVLMDMHMPVMDGLTATQHARECGLDLPIVALTAMVTKEEKQKCLDAGCTDFLTKPIRVEPMVEVLRQFLPCKVTEVEDQVVKEALAVEAFKKDIESIQETGEAIDLDLESSIGATMKSLGYDMEEEQVLQAMPQPDLALPASPISSAMCEDEEFRPIVEAFVVRLNSRIGEFQVALDNKDLKELSSLAHWLAGATGTVGLDEFVEPARELENSDGSDPQRMQQLVTYLTRLSQWIDISQSQAAV